jgi:hypothetical protein
MINSRRLPTILFRYEYQVMGNIIDTGHQLLVSHLSPRGQIIMEAVNTVPINTKANYALLNLQLSYKNIEIK